MEKKRFFSVLSIAYAIVMIFIFTAFLLVATSKGADKVAILGRRFLYSLIFGGLGGLLLLFKERVAKSVYARADIATFKDEEGKQKAIHQVKYMGTCMLIVGVSLLSLALILFFIL